MPKKYAERWSARKREPHLLRSSEIKSTAERECSFCGQLVNSWTAIGTKDVCRPCKKVHYPVRDEKVANDRVIRNRWVEPTAELIQGISTDISGFDRFNPNCTLRETSSKTALDCSRLHCEEGNDIISIALTYSTEKLVLNGLFGGGISDDEKEAYYNTALPNDVYLNGPARLIYLTKDIEDNEYFELQPHPAGIKARRITDMIAEKALQVIENMREQEAAEVKVKQTLWKSVTGFVADRTGTRSTCANSPQLPAAFRMTVNDEDDIKERQKMTWSAYQCLLLSADITGAMPYEDILEASLGREAYDELLNHEKVNELLEESGIKALFNQLPKKRWVEVLACDSSKKKARKSKNKIVKPKQKTFMSILPSALNETGADTELSSASSELLDEDVVIRPKGHFKQRKASAMLQKNRNKQQSSQNEQHDANLERSFSSTISFEDTTHLGSFMKVIPTETGSNKKLASKIDQGKAVLRDGKSLKINNLEDDSCPEYKIKDYRKMKGSSHTTLKPIVVEQENEAPKLPIIKLIEERELTLTTSSRHSAGTVETKLDEGCSALDALEDAPFKSFSQGHEEISSFNEIEEFSSPHNADDLNSCCPNIRFARNILENVSFTSNETLNGDLDPESERNTSASVTCEEDVHDLLQTSTLAEVHDTHDKKSEATMDSSKVVLEVALDNNSPPERKRKRDALKAAFKSLRRGNSVLPERKRKRDVIKTAFRNAFTTKKAVNTKSATAEATAAHISRKNDSDSHAIALSNGNLTTSTDQLKQPPIPSKQKTCSPKTVNSGLKQVSEFSGEKSTKKYPADVRQPQRLEFSSALPHKVEAKQQRGLGFTSTSSNKLQVDARQPQHPEVSSRLTHKRQADVKQPLHLEVFSMATQKRQVGVKKPQHLEISSILTQKYHADVKQPQYPDVSSMSTQPQVDVKLPQCPDPSYEKKSDDSSRSRNNERVSDEPCESSVPFSLTPNINTTLSAIQEIDTVAQASHEVRSQSRKTRKKTSRRNKSLIIVGDDINPGEDFRAAYLRKWEERRNPAPETDLGSDITPREGFRAACLRKWKERTHLRRYVLSKVNPAPEIFVGSDVAPGECYRDAYWRKWENSHFTRSLEPTMKRSLGPYPPPSRIFPAKPLCQKTEVHPEVEVSKNSSIGFNVPQYQTYQVETSDQYRKDNSLAKSVRTRYVPAYLARTESIRARTKLMWNEQLLQESREAGLRYQYRKDDSLAKPVRTRHAPAYLASTDSINARTKRLWNEQLLQDRRGAALKVEPANKRNAPNCNAAVESFNTTKLRVREEDLRQYREASSNGEAFEENALKRPQRKASSKSELSYSVGSKIHPATVHIPDVDLSSLARSRRYTPENSGFLYRYQEPSSRYQELPSRYYEPPTSLAPTKGVRETMLRTQEGETSRSATNFKQQEWKSILKKTDVSREKSTHDRRVHFQGPLNDKVSVLRNMKSKKKAISESAYR